MSGISIISAGMWRDDALFLISFLTLLVNSSASATLAHFDERGRCKVLGFILLILLKVGVSAFNLNNLTEFVVTPPAPMVLYGRLILARLGIVWGLGS
jgi:hypothetical protein